MNEVLSVIDRMQGEAGYASGGEVDRLVYTALDVHLMLSEIKYAISEYMKEVE